MNRPDVYLDGIGARGGADDPVLRRRRCQDRADGNKYRQPGQGDQISRARM